MLVYSQSVGNFIGHINLSATSSRVIRDDTSGSNFRKLEVPLSLVPFPQKSLHVEVGHGHVLRAEAQARNLGFAYGH